MAEPMNPVAPVRKTRMRSLLAEGRVVGGDVQGFFAPAVPKAALVHGRDVPPWIRWKHSSRVARARGACFPAPRSGNWRHARTPLASLFLAAPAPALRHLGQRGRAAAAPHPWRPRPLPQLGLGGGAPGRPLPPD